jgi:hypothetical protein
VKFETSQFDKDMFDKEDFFRNTDRSMWRDRRGFTNAAKENSLSPIHNRSKSPNPTSTTFEIASEPNHSLIDPYKDPHQHPDFMRT